MVKENITLIDFFLSFRGRINRSSYILYGWLPLMILTGTPNIIYILSEKLIVGTIAWIVGSFCIWPTIV